MKKNTLVMILGLMLFGGVLIIFWMQKNTITSSTVSELKVASSSISEKTVEYMTSTTPTSSIEKTSVKVIVPQPKPKIEYANPTDACIGKFLEEGEKDVNKILEVCLGISQ